MIIVLVGNKTDLNDKRFAPASPSVLTLTDTDRILTLLLLLRSVPLPDK